MYEVGFTDEKNHNGKLEELEILGPVRMRYEESFFRGNVKLQHLPPRFQV
jgi:hypothetical protein